MNLARVHHAKPKYLFGMNNGLFKPRSRYVNGKIVNALFVDACVDGVSCILGGTSCLRTLAKAIYLSIFESAGEYLQ